MDVAAEKFSFSIDMESPVPVYEQIKEKIRFLVVSGTLKPGERLMPIRELAKLLGINHNTIVKVYYQLDVEGYIFSRAGRGFFVKELSEEDQVSEKERLMSEVTDEFIKKSTDLGYNGIDAAEYVKKRFESRFNKTVPEEVSEGNMRR